MRAATADITAPCSQISIRNAVIRADHKVIISLVKETDDLTGHVLATGLLVVHNSSRGGQDDVAELTRRKELDDPLLQVGELDVVAWGDNTGLVEAGTIVRGCNALKRGTEQRTGR